MFRFHSQGIRETLNMHEGFAIEALIYRSERISWRLCKERQAKGVEGLVCVEAKE